MYHKNAPETNVNVDVNVDVPKIVKYSCLSAVLIIGIIFGTRTYLKISELQKKTDK